MAGVRADKSEGAAELATRLLEIIGGLTLELQPERSLIRIGLDSDLDREPGFDSLSRVELLIRIERSLDVRLPEQVFSTAETPRDLLQAVLAARSARNEMLARIELDQIALRRAPP